MVLLAMMLFGLMAMAALVIDLGFARLAQRQMQTAVDAAALEGLRYRDELPPGYQEMPHEIARRENARDFAAWVFDDDFDTASDTQQFGAGPIIEFTGGAGDPSLFASQLMEVPEVPVFKPGDDGSDTTALQLNLGDDITGDMVGGRYAPEPPEGATPEERARFHQERSDYSRDDFPSPVATTTSYPAFLVRMRRTGEEFDPAGGVGSAGPTIPYLFGRGSLLNRQTIGAGINARATAIAALQPVVCVGPYMSLPSQEAGTSNREVSGALTYLDPISQMRLGVAVSIGDWEEGDFGDLQATSSSSIVIGDRVSGVATVSSEPGTRYLAVYAPIPDGEARADRVIGFVRVRVSQSQEIEKIPPDIESLIACENASATFAVAIGEHDGVPLTQDDRRAVFEANRNFARTYPAEVLLAPVSAR